MATVYLKQSSNTDTYGGFPSIPSFGGEWDGSDVGGRNPDWLTGMRVSYNGKIYEALTNHDGDVNSPPNTNTTDWREVSGTLDDPYKATDLIQSNFLLDSLTDGDEVILTDGLYDYLPFSSTVYPQNGRPTLRALNDYEAIIGQSSFKPANILCVGLDVRSPAVNGYANYPDGGRVGFNYHRCILSSGYWWPPANCVVTNCLIKQTNVLFYAAFGQATNSASTDKAIQMLNNTVILTSNSGQPLLNTLINQGLTNPVFKNNIFYIKSHTGSTSLAPSNGFYKGTWENNVFFDTSGQVVNNTGNLINIEPSFVNPLGSSFRDFQLRPSSSLIGGIKKSSPLETKYPNAIWFDSNYGSTGTGTVTDPYSNFATAVADIASNDNVIAVLDGSHSLVQSETGGSGTTSTFAFSGGSTATKLTIVGESIDGTTLVASGSSWGSAFNLRATSIALKLETLTLQNDTNSHLGVIVCGDNTSVEAIECKLTLGAGASDNGNGWFVGDTNPDSSLTIKNCFIDCASNATSKGALAGGGSEDGYNVFDIQGNTLVINGGSANYFIDNNVGASLSSFVLKNNILVGNKGTELISNSTTNIQPTTASHNCYHNLGVNSGNAPDSAGAVFADPQFLDSTNGDYRLRPSSSCIGDAEKSKFPLDAIWIEAGSGNNGSGTEGDPFSWNDQYSEAFLAAAQSSSNQIVFKDGQYVWTSAILQDDNVGNNITMISENIHQAIFTDAGRISSATKYPTLRFKGIQLVANDHFTWKQECHYILDSVHVLAGKYMGASSVTASGCIFEVPSGVNAYVFSSTGPVDITNCTFVDHNDRTSGSNYLTGAQSGTIKSTIFYTKTPKTYCINPSHNAVLTNCASENITNPEDGVVFNENLGFLDIDNKNYNLRPTSKLIGRAL